MAAVITQQIWIKTHDCTLQGYDFSMPSSDTKAKQSFFSTNIMLRNSMRRKRDKENIDYYIMFCKS